MSVLPIGPLNVGADMLLPLTFSEAHILWCSLTSARAKQGVIYNFDDDEGNLYHETDLLLEDANCPIALRIRQSRRRHLGVPE